MSRVRAWLPGLALSAGVAALGWLLYVAQLRAFGSAVVEGLVAAILIGIVVRTGWGLPQRFAAGVGIAGREGLEIAVALLGASMSLLRLLEAGPRLLFIVVGVVVLALALGTLVGRAVGLNARLATLVSVGNAICGNSAIAAVAPVIKAKPDEVASAIAFTAVLGVGVVLALPGLIPVLGLSEYQYGVLAGLSVYAVPQVLAATLPVSPLSAQVGALVKLTRVLMLGPVVLFYSLRHRQATGGTKLSRFVPWFVVAFLGLAVLRSLGAIPDSLSEAAVQVSRGLTLIAMAALGLSVDVRLVRRAGARVSLAVLLSVLMLIALGALAVRLLLV